MSGPVRGTELAMLTPTAAAREGSDAMDMKPEVVTIPDENWPDRSTEYMVAEQAGTELPT